MSQRCPRRPRCPVVRWLAGSSVAAPPTAAGQAGSLKNACRLRMRNSPMADWRPGGAPAIPGTPVMAAPRDLLLGIGILAVMPAASPGTTHAMTPVTGSFVSDQAANAVTGHEG